MTSTRRRKKKKEKEREAAPGCFALVFVAKREAAARQVRSGGTQSLIRRGSVLFDFVGHARNHVSFCLLLSYRSVINFRPVHSLRFAGYISRVACTEETHSEIEKLQFLFSWLHFSFSNFQMANQSTNPHS